MWIRNGSIIEIYAHHQWRPQDYPGTTRSHAVTWYHLISGAHQSRCLLARRFEQRFPPMPRLGYSPLNFPPSHLPSLPVLKRKRSTNSIPIGLYKNHGQNGKKISANFIFKSRNSRRIQGNISRSRSVQKRRIINNAI